MTVLLLRPRDFFDNQTIYWIPACSTTSVSVSRAVSNSDSYTDFSLVNVVTVALYCTRSVIVLFAISYSQNCINRQWTAALRAIEDDEPSLTAAAAPTHIDVALENNTKGCVIVDFSKLRQQQK